jgi:hypothetical protein
MICKGINLEISSLRGYWYGSPLCGCPNRSELYIKESVEHKQTPERQRILKIECYHMVLIRNTSKANIIPIT